MTSLTRSASSGRARRAVAVRVVLGAFLSTVAGAAAALATTVAPLDLRALSQRADAVVVARCTSVRSGVDALTHRLATSSSFAVDEVVKGSAVGREVTVSLPGGAADGRAATIAGVPSFAEGRGVVLFLTAPRSDGARGILGFDQGAFEVTSGPSGAQVRSSASEPGGAGATVGANAVSLSDFLAQVRGYLR